MTLAMGASVEKPPCWNPAASTGQRVTRTSAAENGSSQVRTADVRFWIATQLALPEQIHGILLENGIGADQWRLFGVCLRDQQPIEGIVVMAWQCIQREHVPDADIEQFVTMRVDLLAHNLRKRHIHIQLPRACLIWISHSEATLTISTLPISVLSGSLWARATRAESCSGASSIHEGVRIEQQPHGRPLNQKSLESGALKSGCMRSLPR